MHHKTSSNRHKQSHSSGHSSSNSTSHSASHSPSHFPRPSSHSLKHDRKSPSDNKPSDPKPQTNISDQKKPSNNRHDKNSSSSSDGLGLFPFGSISWGSFLGGYILGNNRQPVEKSTEKIVYRDNNPNPCMEHSIALLKCFKEKEDSPEDCMYIIQRLRECQEKIEKPVDVSTEYP